MSEKNGIGSPEDKTLRQYISEMNSKLDRVTNILLGDKEADVKGLVHKVKDHEDYIRQDKKFKWGVATILFSGTGGFMAWIKSHLDA